MRLLQKLFSRGRQEKTSLNQDLLDAVLLRLSPEDCWTFRDACEGIAVFGGTGSGKTSGSGQHLAKAFLKQSFGGLVLTAKPDERALWERYCKETGRIDDLMILSPTEPLRFNFMDYELNRKGAGAGLTMNLVSLFSTLTEVGSTNKTKSADQYWQNAMKQLLRNVVDLISIAGEKLSVPIMNDVILSAPNDPIQVKDPTWQSESLCFKLIQNARQNANLSREKDLSITAKYWLMEYPNLSEKTRSIVVSSFTSLADCFLRGTLRELFCTETNFTPEDSFKGKILLIDLPIKEYNELGAYAEILFKMQWQRAAERRPVKLDTKPVFLWVDESQFFYVDKTDMQFQTTARSSRIATVLLTQSYSNYLAVAGQGNQSQIDSFLGNLSTKIFHAQGDTKTNEWAAQLFAKDLTYRANFGANSNQQNNINMNSNIDFQIQPIEFSRLAKGGPQNNFKVQAIMYQAGRIWKATNTNYLFTSFAQK